MGIREVAESAGVCPATVSRVLNDGDSVAPATRAAVLAAVARLRYTPGRPGRPRRSDATPPTARRTNRIALLVTGLRRAQLAAPVYLQVLHGVETAVALSGKTLVLRHVPFADLPTGDLLPTTVDGVVIFGPTPDAQLAPRLAGIPCVRVMGQVPTEGHWDHVSYDNQGIGPLAAEHLFQGGHRHVAFLGEGSAPFFLARGRSFQAAMTALGGTVAMYQDNDLLQIGEQVQQVAPPRMGNFLDWLQAQRPRPTAVFAVADTLAPALYQQMYRRGLRPGRDLTIMSCNYERVLLADLSPRPASIDIHAEQVGSRAVEQVLWRQEHPTAPRVAVALEPTLVPAPPAD